MSVAQPFKEDESTAHSSFFPRMAILAALSSALLTHPEPSLSPSIPTEKLDVFDLPSLQKIQFSPTFGFEDEDDEEDIFFPNERRTLKRVKDTRSSLFSWLCLGDRGSKTTKFCQKIDRLLRQEEGLPLVTEELLPQHIPTNAHLLVEQVSDALAQRAIPQLVNDGMAGVYFVPSAPESHLTPINLAVFKPHDEEVGALMNPKGNSSADGVGSARPSLGSGQGMYREVAAALLDHNGLAGVPPTTLVNFPEGLPGVGDGTTPKQGSLQQFVSSECCADDMGCNLFPVDEVQKIALLDMRCLNLDRHPANILVCKSGQEFSLVPIDHGCCFPSRLGVCDFEWCWIDWPQVKESMSSELKEYISSLSADEDIKLLESCKLELDRKSLQVFRLVTKVIQAMAASDRTLHDIARFICRSSQDEPSPLERVVSKCRWIVAGQRVVSNRPVCSCGMSSSPSLCVQFSSGDQDLSEESTCDCFAREVCEKVCEMLE